MSFLPLDQELHVLHILPHSPTLNLLQSECRNHYYKFVSDNQSNMETAGETKSENQVNLCSFETALFIKRWQQFLMLALSMLYSLPPSLVYQDETSRNKQKSLVNDKVPEHNSEKTAIPKFSTFRTSVAIWKVFLMPDLVMLDSKGQKDNVWYT